MEGIELKTIKYVVSHNKSDKGLFYFLIAIFLLIYLIIYKHGFLDDKIVIYDGVGVNTDSYDTIIEYFNWNFSTYIAIFRFFV